MGGLPLLVLEHDSSLDALFIRSFFNIYYKAAFFTALGASLSFAILGRAMFAIGAAALALTVVLIRSRLIPTMDQIGSQIQTSDSMAIQKFRRVHSAALLVNLIQLVLLVWALLKFSL
jgi:hypothetical protein